MKLNLSHNMTSEQRLVSEVKRGDRLAMRRLYDEYSGYAMSVGLRYVPDRDDVLDILQDSFIKVFQRIGDFEYRGEGSLKSWIARITANEALGLLRQRNRMTFTDKLPEASTDDEPDMAMVSDDVLNGMIGRLPDGYRVVLNLYVFAGMSHKEIAAELGISPSTSASQFFHARKMLANMINDYNKKQR